MRRLGAFGIVLFLVYLASPVSQVVDSCYTVLLSETLLYERTFALDRFFPSAVRSTAPPGVEYPYQLIAEQGHVHYYYPNFPSVLAMPAVWLANRAGVSAGAGGAFDFAGEIRIQAWLGALCAALTGMVLLRSALRVLPFRTALFLASAAAFGTQLWSTASRAYGSDTVATLFMTLAADELLRARGREPRALRLGCWLSFAYFARPTAAVPIIAACIYLLFRHRRSLPSVALVGCAWLAVFLGWSRAVTGDWLPMYYAQRGLSFEQFWRYLYVHTLSPSRGWFIYCPMVLCLAIPLARAWRSSASRALMGLALAICAAHLVLLSTYAGWWGGGSYGARYMTGLVPWVHLLAVLEVAAVPPGRLFRVVSLAAVALSVALNARGACELVTWQWNGQPVSVNDAKERVLDWRQPQFLAGWIAAPLPERAPAWPAHGALHATDPAAAGFFWDGWGGPESDYRWTVARNARLIFECRNTAEAPCAAAHELRIALRPYTGVKGRPQRLKLRLGGRLLADLVLSDPGARRYRIRVPDGCVNAGLNVLEFKLPDAFSPYSSGAGPDRRRLGVAVYEIDRVVEPALIDVR